MKMRHVRMPEKLWEAIPDENRSEWIRTAIKMRIARDQYGLKDEYIDALNESQTQVRKVGIAFNQIARRLNRSEQYLSDVQIKEVIDCIRKIMSDIQTLKNLYLNEQ